MDLEANNTGQSDDFDNDGLTNLEEYYHGTDPTAVDPSQFEFSPEDGTLQYQRSTLSNDLIPVLQSGGTFEDFTTITPAETATALSGQLETTTINIDLREEALFFRIGLQTL